MPAIDPNQLPTQILPWGALKWFVTPTLCRGSDLSVGEVLLLPGTGHTRHRHEDFEQVI